MQLRRVALPLPLILAALALTAGCVTVRPTGPAEPAPPAPAVDRTAARETAVGALPLGRLPAPEPPPAPPAAEAEAEPEPPAAQPEENRPPQRRTGGRAPARPAHPVHPAPAPKPRKRPPVRPKPRPAQPRAYDMAPLCEAAKGTVSPSIVALCR
ncbi:hypothetical protein [Streptomyces sp. A1547]|uniref:hypothetical protein n=1 Tax=Streptomyces sp. A1547 TaxID=2563105 RepID=UPI000B0253EE|nr:hypothetical protein [Streptomyces sp. A1547]THA41438.1 hypothetical protein E6W17_00450 [Streptomyces sp. A1547]